MYTAYDITVEIFSETWNTKKVIYRVFYSQLFRDGSIFFGTVKVRHVYVHLSHGFKKKQNKILNVFSGKSDVLFTVSNGDFFTATVGSPCSRRRESRVRSRHFPRGNAKEGRRRARIPSRGAVRRVESQDPRRRSSPGLPSARRKPLASSLTACTRHGHARHGPNTRVGATARRPPTPQSLRAGLRVRVVVRPFSRRSEITMRGQQNPSSRGRVLRGFFSDHPEGPRCRVRVGHLGPRSVRSRFFETFRRETRPLAVVGRPMSSAE